MPPSSAQAASNYADTLTRSATFAQRISKAQAAYADVCGFDVNPYHRLRERYATGRISLGQFEAEVEVLLRRAA